MMEASGIPIEQIKKSMREAWMAGDFGVVAKTVATGAGDFISRMAIPAGAVVLDVACGTGNLAIPLARGGAVVTGRRHCRQPDCAGARAGSGRGPYSSFR